mmetsp:Transcript_10264/g.24657  ORF Transcript_10264/g.24657 Transcript_10264/m.24657 type:complete len:391 (+) Transcript_10264:87-1259(+)
MAALGFAQSIETGPKTASPLPGRVLSSLSSGKAPGNRPHTYSEGQSTSAGSMPAVTPSSSEWESLLDEAHEPSQEALNSIVDMLNAQKARLLQENHMLSLESEIVRLSKENQALRASVEAAYVYNPVNPVVPMPNPMMLPASVLMPVDAPGPGGCSGAGAPLPSTIPWSGPIEDLDLPTLGGMAPDFPGLTGQEATKPPAAMKPVPGVGIKRVGKVEPKEVAPSGPDPQGRTTVMLRNLPNNYTRDMLLDLIDSMGFRGQYDFLYLPIDFQTHACLGYAFVNLVDPGAVPSFWTAFDGFSNWSLPSKKVCYISWSGPHQGLEAHIERYRNSPVMHGEVGDECKPLIFRDGVRIEFPPPTKSIRPPRVRKRVETAANPPRANAVKSQVALR